MPNNPVEPIRESMTFSDYFSTHEDVEDVLASFGYTYDIQPLVLPSYKGDVSWAIPLRERFSKILRRVTLTSEISRREFLIAPIVTELVDRFDIKVRSEWTLKVSDRLQGNIDYLLQGREDLVVIEAKQGDLARGFRQLAAEMVAVDKWSTSPTTHFYGAVSIGETWRFVHLNRQNKKVVQDENLINVPEETELLVRVLVAALFGEESIVTDRTPSA